MTFARSLARLFTGGLPTADAATARANLAAMTDLVSSGTIDNVAQQDLPLPTTFKSFKLIMRGMEPSVAANPLIRAQIGGTLYLTNGNYGWSSVYVGQGPTAGGYFTATDTSATSSTGIPVSAYNQVAAAGNEAHFEVDISPGAPAKTGSILFRSIVHSSANPPGYSQGGGYLGIGGRWQSIRVLYSGTTLIRNCEYELYGLRG
jgi:hypothetical protein